MRAALWVVALTVVAQTSPALAQTYATPAPRSTDASAMRDAATQREVRERFARGIAAEMRGDHPSAIAEFEAVLRRKPREPQRSTAHYDLALAAAGAGDLERAATELRAAIDGDPGFLAAYANLVAIELRRGDAAAARAAADRLVALAPDSARALYSRGLVALNAGDLATARVDFTRLLAGNPAYAPAHYDLGIVELRAGRLQSAERELSAALTAAPDYARARFALGMVFLREGRRDEARVAFERVTHEANDPGLRNLAGAARDTLSAP